MTVWRSYKPHFITLIVLGAPLMGGHLAQMAIGLTDTVFIGWYGVEELAAIVLAQTLFATIFLFGSCFAWATLPMVSSAHVRGDHLASRRITRMGLWASMIFALASLPLFIWSETLFLLLAQEPLVARLASEYLLIAAVGLFPALGVMVLKSFMAALEDTRAVFWITLLAAIANAGLNWVLVFGKLGAPELGLAGAAIASVLTQLVTFVLAVLHVQRKHPSYALFERLWRVDRAVLAQIVRLGVPIGFTTLAEVGLFAASSVFMGILGKIPLAAHGIALQVTTVFFMVQVGLSNAATIRAGQSAARADRAELLTGARAAMWLAFAFAVLASLCMWLIPGALIGLFLEPNDPDRAAIIALGSMMLIYAGLFQIVDGQQVVALGVLRGVQDTRIPLIIAVISYWLIGLSCSAILGFGFDLGPAGVWIGLVVGLSLAALLLHWRIWTAAPSLIKPSIAFSADAQNP